MSSKWATKRRDPHACTFSLLYFSSLVTSLGKRSPTMLSARSCTSAILMHLGIMHSKRVHNRSTSCYTPFSIHWRIVIASTKQKSHHCHPKHVRGYAFRLFHSSQHPPCAFQMLSISWNNHFFDMIDVCKNQPWDFRRVWRIRTILLPEVAWTPWLTGHMEVEGWAPPISAVQYVWTLRDAPHVYTDHKDIPRPNDLMGTRVGGHLAPALVVWLGDIVTARAQCSLSATSLFL